MARFKVLYVIISLLFFATTLGGCTAPAPTTQSPTQTSLPTLTPSSAPAQPPTSSTTPTPAPTPTPSTPPTPTPEPTPTMPPKPALTTSASPIPTVTSTPTPSPTPSSLPASGPGWRVISAPAGGDKLQAQWIEVDAPGGYKLNAAVFYPSTQGPYPIVLILHGTAGFQARAAPLGDVFAKAGFLSIYGAWFKGNADKYNSTLVPIACPNGPPFSGANLDSTKYVKSLINVSRQLPGAIGRNVGLIGISRGATEALLVASTKEVQAVVSDSATYDPRTSFDTPPLAEVKNLSAPVLILHGTADETVPVQEARDYERALVQWKKPFEVHYYEGGLHGVTIYPGTRADAQKRSIDFFSMYFALANPSIEGR